MQNDRRKIGRYRVVFQHAYEYVEDAMDSIDALELAMYRHFFQHDDWPRLPAVIIPLPLTAEQSDAIPSEPATDPPPS